MTIAFIRMPDFCRVALRFGSVCVAVRVFSRTFNRPSVLLCQPGRKKQSEKNYLKVLRLERIDRLGK